MMDGWMDGWVVDKSIVRWRNRRVDRFVFDR